MVLDRLSLRVTCPNLASFRFWPVARRDSRGLILLRTSFCSDSITRMTVLTRQSVFPLCCECSFHMPDWAGEEGGEGRGGQVSPPAVPALCVSQFYDCICHRCALGTCRHSDKLLWPRKKSNRGIVCVAWLKDSHESTLASVILGDRQGETEMERRGERRRGRERRGETGRDRNGETGRDTERQGEAERDGKRQRERNRETEKERRCKLMTAAKLVCGAKIDCGGKTKSGSVMSQTACLHITDDVFHSGTSANTQPQDILFLHATCPSLLSLRVCLCHDELHLGLVCLVIELVAWLVLSLPSWLPTGLSVCLVRLTGAQSLATIQGHI